MTKITLSDTLKKKLSFLGSSRFWAMLFAATSQYLQVEGIISLELANYLTTVFGLFVGIRTVDRFAEKNGSVDTGKK